MSPALSFSGECTETFTDLLCTNVWILPNFHTVHAHVHRFPDIYFLCISTYLHFFLTKTTKVRRFPRDLCFLSGISLFFSFKPLIGGIKLAANVWYFPRWCVLQMVHCLGWLQRHLHPSACHFISWAVKNKPWRFGLRGSSILLSYMMMIS